MLSRLTTALALGSATLLLQSVAGADEASDHAELEALSARLADLEKREARAEAARPIMPIVLTGFVQVDWNVVRQSSQDDVTQDGQPLNDDRFLVRRARIRGERDFGYVHGLVEIDANTVDGVQVRPTGVEASFKWPANRPYSRTPWAIEPAGSKPRLTTSPNEANEANAARAPTNEPPPPGLGPNDPWFRVSAGLLRTPFGVEVPEWDYDRTFLERSAIANALFPGTVDLGVGIFGGFRFIRYELAVMNGDPIGEHTFPGRDPSKSKDLVFRVGAASVVTDGVRFEGGISGLTGRGFHAGTPATVDQIQWQDANNNGQVDGLTELQVIPGSPAKPSATFKRFAVGADAKLAVKLPVVGDFQLRGEVVRSENLDRGTFVSDPIASTRNVRQLGYWVAGIQDVTPWAQVGVRYDRYDPDSDAREQEPFSVVPRDLAMSTWAFTGVARLWLLRLIAEFDLRHNALGRDASGRPTNLADNGFSLRAEMRF